MAKKFQSTTTILQCTTPGKNKTEHEPAVAPVMQEIPAGTILAASDFSKEDFTTFVKDGTLIEVEVADADDEAAAYYDTQTRTLTPSGELPETEEKKRERLTNEALMLGIKVSENTKVETIEQKIAEARNKRSADDTTASRQEGAGRADPSNGSGPAGGNAEGTAKGAKPSQTGKPAKSDEDVIG